MKVNRIALNEKKALVYIMLFICLILHSCFVHGQSFGKNNEFLYRGFEVGFGKRSFSLKSNISELNGLQVEEDGGHAGIIGGNKVFITKLGIGFYYSANNVCQSVRLFESDASVNFFPLQLISRKETRVEPYLVGSLNYNKLQFFGFYLDEDPQKMNYSASQVPYLGSINELRASTGAGIEFKVLDQFDFVHLYGEVKYGVPFIDSTTKQSAFENTAGGNQCLFSIGVRFGAFR